MLSPTISDNDWRFFQRIVQLLHIRSVDMSTRNDPESATNTEDGPKIIQAGYGDRLKAFIRDLYRRTWLRATYMLVILLISFVNLILSWCVVMDLLNQQPGLVYGITPNVVVISSMIFTASEVVFFGLDIFLWINTLWNGPDAWFCVDVANALNIFLSEIPLGVLNTYLSACRESAISAYVHVKASIILSYMLLRFVTFTTVYLLESTDDGYVDINSFVSNPETPEAQVQKRNMFTLTAKRLAQPVWFDIIRKKNLRRYWLVIRILIVLGFFILLLTNVLIFKFTFIQTFRGYLEWRRVDRKAMGSLEDVLAERYFHDVEVFLKETELPTHKWLHLVSLEKLIDLQRKGITEQIGLSYIRSKGKVFCVFSQLLVHKNSTTETSMTCWNELGKDVFEEAACEEIFDTEKNLPNFHRLKNLKIQFTYEPPSSHRHLGVLFYNATRTDSNNTVFRNISLHLEYFRNTIAHRLAQSKGQMDDAAHDHDGWSSGPFRPSDLYLADGGTYIKYAQDTGDLIPVSKVWRTGFSMCQSNAPSGPLRLII